MRKKLASTYCILATLVTVVALTANSAHVQAADYSKVGVKVGNTADYQTSVTGQTYNKTHLLVYGIVGSVIYANFTDYYPNGMIAKRYQIVGDIFIGTYPIYMFFIAANLTAGDPIYSGAPVWINETITMTFAGVPRIVNHVRTADGLFEAYWDKATGLMTKLNEFFLVWNNMTIKSTDAWAAGPTPQRLSVKLSGELDYSDKEDIRVRLAALVKDLGTLYPVSGADVNVNIYYPDDTLWAYGKMLEKIAGTGIYEWNSSLSISKMKMKEGVYLVQVKASVGSGPIASDMLLFHIDPPGQSDEPPSSVLMSYLTPVLALVVGTMAGAFAVRKHKRILMTL